MARAPTKPPTKDKIKRSTISDMKVLEIYKPQFNRIIEIYAELVFQYNTLSAEFEENGYQYEVNTDQGGAKKSPILASLETLRKDILAYSDRLCLNPKSMDALTIKKKKPGESKLQALMNKRK
ncbi:phage terminase, small subunit, putative, P27 family [Paenibacillus sp. UNCCL117]|uniref:P27 family phage terminase small subunit n=1 Tax=unclassified Paenibacillus TaxID=185978 RepID=UPI00087FC9F2|nr:MULTISPECIES: P27 family phage terminase small subunit [unclassified Paenibacillus]SDC69665.1 phage terminase, small subunit, putative, P27 family [Paenibacillus sp. cl123]SFW23997.1 phage terminase, small subunit, putative, P27 family [Paenibacillus sp. UNCCL117]